MGIELTPRCKALRTIAANWDASSRICFASAPPGDLGAFTAFLYGFTERRSHLRTSSNHERPALPQQWTRGRSHMDYPDEAVFKRMSEFNPTSSFLVASKTWKNCSTKPHLRGSHAAALAHEPRGKHRLVVHRFPWPGFGRRARHPQGRALSLFCRQLDGKGAAAVDFQSPHHEHRRRVRPLPGGLEEMKQSAHIIRQSSISSGRRSTFPPKEKRRFPQGPVFSSIEGLIQHLN